MTDIVERLRFHASHKCRDLEVAAKEAADEIERLRAKAKHYEVENRQLRAALQAAIKGEVPEVSDAHKEANMRQTDD